MKVIVSCRSKQSQVEVNFSVNLIFVTSSIYHLTAKNKLELNLVNTVRCISKLEFSLLFGTVAWWTAN